MSEKTILYLILVVAAANLYVSYQIGTGLQDAADKIKNPLKALGIS